MSSAFGDCRDFESSRSTESDAESDKESDTGSDKECGGTARHLVVYQCIAWSTLLFAESLDALTPPLLTVLFPVVPRHWLCSQGRWQDLWYQCTIPFSCPDEGNQSAMTIALTQASTTTSVSLTLPARMGVSAATLVSVFLEGGIAEDVFMDEVWNWWTPLMSHVSSLCPDDNISDGFLTVLRHLLKLSGRPPNTRDCSLMLSDNITVTIEADENASSSCALHTDTVTCDVIMLVWVPGMLLLKSTWGVPQHPPHGVLSELVATIRSSYVGCRRAMYFHQFVVAYVRLWSKYIAPSLSLSCLDKEVTCLLDVMRGLLNGEISARNDTMHIWLFSDEDMCELLPLPEHYLFASVLRVLYQANGLSLTVIEYLFQNYGVPIRQGRKHRVNAVVQGQLTFFLDATLVSLVLDILQNFSFPSRGEYLRLCAVICQFTRSYGLDMECVNNMSKVLGEEALSTIARYAFDAEDFTLLETLFATMATISTPLSGFRNATLLNALTGYGGDTVSEDMWITFHSYLGTSELDSMLYEPSSLGELKTESLLKLYSLLQEYSIHDHGGGQITRHAHSTTSTQAHAASPPTADLSDCFQGVVPLCIAQLHSLHSLVLSHNDIVQFPLHILSLSNLVRLNLSWNKLASIPKIIGQTLVKLQILDLSHNCLTEFPKCILKLRALVELYIQHNNVEEIRNDILLLEKLRHLDVSNNRLKAIPPRLNQSLKLQYFRFSGNPLFDISNGSAGSG